MDIVSAWAAVALPREREGQQPRVTGRRFDDVPVAAGVRHR